MYPETREGALRYIIASQNSGRGKANSKALGELLEKEGNRRDVEAIQKGEKYENTVDTLSGETLDLIYGKNIGLSVSRLESYAQCQFKYFLTYGLGLREREKYEVNPANVGNILHGTMRDMFDYVKTFKDNDWNSLSEEDITEKTRNFLRAEAKNEADTYFDDTNRATYKLELLSDMAVRTIKTLREFICCGGMKPEQFEIKFDTAKDGIKDYIFELPNGMNMSLKGIIDRVDVAVKENDVYYKIVDYKSSGRTLRTEEIIAGLALQLITYGAVFLNGGEKYVPKDYFLESDGEEKNAHLAALNYYEFKNAIVAGDETTDRVRYKDGEPGFEICEEPDYVESEILKDSRYTGLNLKDTTAREIMDADGKTIKARSDIEEAELKILMDFNRENLRELGEHMAKGEIEIKPMLNGGESACKYCNFRGICNFDNRFGGNTYGHVDENKLKKFLNFQEIFAKKEQILKDIKKLEKEKASLETKVEKAQEALTKAKDKVEEKGEKATANMKETLVKKQSAYDEAMEKLQEKINTLAEKKQRLSETGNL
jgi:ATP-dependent helicase/nuclease subunit B